MHLWEIDLIFAPRLPPGWGQTGSAARLAALLALEGLVVQLERRVMQVRHRLARRLECRITGQGAFVRRDAQASWNTLKSFKDFCMEDKAGIWP